MNRERAIEARWREEQFAEIQSRLVEYWNARIGHERDVACSVINTYAINDEIFLFDQIALLSERVYALEAALTPFAALGAAVAARPAYPPTQELMRVGEAAFTVAHLIAAADVLAVRAEAVTGGSVGTGISEIMEDSK